MKNDFSIGQVITLKSHPLLKQLYIHGDEKLVPPLMLVKEVFFERKTKKTHDEKTGQKIADRIKYNCVYFDENKLEFKETFLYESMLEGIKDLRLARVTENIIEEDITLVEKVEKYDKPKYKYGELYFLKTLKLEAFKKRKTKVIKIDEKGEIIKGDHGTIKYVANFTSPAFISCGYKENEEKELFYHDGEPKKMISKELIKVKWFNVLKQKFSEEYMPIEFFIDKDPFKD